MSSIKQLKKIAKKGKYFAATQSQRRLKLDPTLTGDLKQVGRQTGEAMARELLVPFSPLLSWFDDAPSIQLGSVAPTLSQQASANSGVPGSNAAAIARLPLKSPPCKRCPAQMGGLCKCAMKKFALAG